MAGTYSAQRQQIIDTALLWVGTPYHHYACTRGVGVDCGMLIVGIARDLGIVPPQWTPPFYSQQWHLHQRHELHCEILEAQGASQLSLGQRCPGDILLFRWLAAQPASHAAILMPGDMMVHAWAARNPQKAVVRHEPFSGVHLNRLAYVYAWPEIRP